MRGECEAMAFWQNIINSTVTLYTFPLCVVSRYELVQMGPVQLLVVAPVR